MLAIATDVYI